MNQIVTETFVNQTGRVPGWKANLAPIRELAHSELPNRIHSASMLEGMIELRVDGVPFLGTEIMGFGYIDSYWEAALPFVASLFGLASAKWAMHGKDVHLWCECLPGTRRGELRLVIRQSVEMITAVHIPTLAEALLAAADEYLRWLPPSKAHGRLAQLEQLRVMPRPWRPIGNG
ncbi:MAG: hypothetical protein K2Q20_05175 [Phycisphaerales bacterium]|nr:hypothetical protein [Phycisphaerales bacterium]